MDPPPARPAVETGRPASTDPERDLLLQELTQILADEATRLQQHGSTSMSVAFQIEEQMELFIHFTQATDAVEVQVRCVSSDYARLEAIWPRLTGMLAPRLRLAPLRHPTDTDSSRGAAPATGVPRLHPERRRRLRRPGWETWA